jgi:hypothetical protein
MPALDVLNADAATTAVTVIEAKGHNTDPAAADIRRGIHQAHGHLSEVNLGYVATPTQSITDWARALARDLDIGIIAVETLHDATLIEPARVTGAGDFSTTIDAIRFQATTHRRGAGSTALLSERCRLFNKAEEDFRHIHPLPFPPPSERRYPAAVIGFNGAI